MRSSKIYKFGPYSLDMAEERLLRGDEHVPLTPKTFETLALLVKHHGHLVPKEELISEVWADSFVEDGSLSHHIYLIRKALGGDEGDSVYIETLTRRGYRFVAPVEELSIAEDVETVLHERHATARIVVEEESTEGEENPSSIVTPDTSPATVVAELGARTKRRRLALILIILSISVAAALGLWYQYSIKQRKSLTTSSIKSLAVLPLQPLGQEKSDEQLGLGMADAIIIKLSTFQQISVLPTSSIYGYTGHKRRPQMAGKELGVDAVLDGTIQRSDGRIRVTAQLISTQEGKTLWSGKFDSQETDLFSMQDFISEQLATKFSQQLSLDEKKQIGKRYTSNADAYQAYLMGLYFYNQRGKEGLRKAVDYFQQAVTLDPQYALGYAVLSDSLNLTAYYNYDTFPKQEALMRAKAAALKAVELDDTLAEAHMARGSSQQSIDSDFRGALESYRRAIALNPNFATAYQRYGWLLLSMGKRDDALRAMRKAVELDPLSKVHNAALGVALVFSHRYDEAIKYYQRTLELDPALAGMHINLGDAFMDKGMSREAIAEYEKLKETKGYETSAREHIAYAYAASGQEDAARKLLNELETERKFQNDASSYNRALIYNLLKEQDRALALLKEPDPDPFGKHLGILYEPRLDNLRSDPRFQEISHSHMRYMDEQSDH